jgi:pimeloyl-ACP methyl ester carboxylesterase
VAELAEVVRRYGNGVGVFDFLVIASIVDPKLTGETFYPVLLFLHLAAQGVPEPLNEAIADLQGGETTPYAQFSAGVHAATLCADSDDFPWGGPRAPLAVRDAAVRRAVAALPGSATYPFPTSVAGEHGVIATCRAWPPARPNPTPPMPRLIMPVLLLAGDRDLSTPLDWAREQARLTPRGKLVVVQGMGHSVQGRNADGDAAVRAFLLG